MDEFRKQILEDISDYRENNPNMKNIDKDEWAFNYWILDKLFSEDEELIEEKIIDYNDKGVDCYVWHEDLHDLYLIQNKSKLLKSGSEENTKVVNFIKNNKITINDILNLYLLYLRAEKEKKNSQSGRMPIPLYLINCFSCFECNKEDAKISDLLSDKDKINKIVNLYKGTITGYYTQWKNMHEGKEYNDMIKSPIDMEMMKEKRSVALSMLE